MSKQTDGDLCIYASRMLMSVNIRSRWGQTLVACSIAFVAVVSGAYFLIENVRAGGAIVVTTIVGLAAYLAFHAPNPSEARGQSIRILVLASMLAIGIGIAGFAAAITLVAARTS
tara:strand:+ start:1790 stop:2134 length:345 start_codon:yes stop_codon:yes gene_type:complete